MNAPTLEFRIYEELKIALNRGLATSALASREKVEQQIRLFRERFGPAVLRQSEGEPLLQLMHGRKGGESKCLAYWLEFKNDDEFASDRFGGIGGGSALKFGLYQRKEDGAWITGSAKAQQTISPEEAIAKARHQREELLAGDKVLAALNASDSSDEVYARLQTEMERAAPELAGSSWAHKYWFLTHHDRVDDYHSPRYQRFHLLKLLQMPPDGVGILDAGAPRFVCAGRFIEAARQFDVPVNTLNTVLNQRDGAMHRYWRIGTTAGDNGESHWPEMRDGGFASVGFSEVPDLTAVIGQDTARERVREWLSPSYPTNPSMASRKTGEILKFAQEMAENDLVLACEGQTVLGVGRIRGPYEYEEKLEFSHKRPVEWLLHEEWPMPDQEGLRTTVWELGRSAKNLLELERRLFIRGPVAAAVPRYTATAAAALSLPPLDPVTARVEGILRRKGQVVFYGPPGTGKTYRALNATKELAARYAFRKCLADLSEAERTMVEGPSGMVRLCTFHPGYGYEDFIEGLRPKTINGQMVFEPRDGIFKQLCDAARKVDRHFFLIVDEINRGDVPRIFGELMTVIEYDKRDLPITLPISGSSFSVPRNVFIVGTMNTADRSISLLDAALRRRFGFVELMPDSSQLNGRKAGSLPLSAWLDALNARLRQHLKRDARNLQIGHAYLLPPQPITSVAEFARVLRDDIIPLLEEYCYEDFRALSDILGIALVDAEGGRIREELFAPNSEEDLLHAVSFEEMQPILLAQGLADDAVGADTTEHAVDESKDALEPAP